MKEADYFKQSKNGYLLEVRVVPNASVTELIKTDTGYKARLCAAPVDGKANAALVALLAKKFALPKSRLEIVKGQTSKTKTVLFVTETPPVINN